MAREPDLYQAKESFVTQLGDEQISVTKGDLVRKDHPLLKGRDTLFKPAQGYVRFDLEQATAAPGEKRGDASASEQEKKERKSRRSSKEAESDAGRDQHA